MDLFITIVSFRKKLKHLFFLILVYISDITVTLSSGSDTSYEFTCVSTGALLCCGYGHVFFLI